MKLAVRKMRLPSANTRRELAADVFGCVKSFKVSPRIRAAREINAVTSIINFDYQLFADEMMISQICVGNVRKNEINSRSVARDLLCALPAKLCRQLINI